MKKTAAILLSLLWATSLCAQTAYSTLGAEHEVRVNSNGSIGINLQSLAPASFYNKDSTKPLLAQAGLWLVAEDENGQYHTAVQYLSGKDSFDFWPGPIDTLTGQTGDISAWDATWYVSNDIITTHKQNFEKPGYNIPDEIANWPAQGNGGFANYLAPFVDVNFNKMYDPENGDYPAIKGAESVYCIFNDLADEHTASFGQEIGIEIQLMVYKPAGASTLFLEYFIINRRPIAYKKIQVGFFISGGCGNPDDNFAGTLQTFPQSIFILNGLDTDQGYFGNKTPYVVATFLNENLTNSIAFTDTELKNGQPKTNSDYLNYGLNIWKDGTNLTWGGDGTEEDTESDFIFAQSNLTEGIFWSEDDENNTPGRRTIIGKNTRKNFNQNNFIKLDIALDVGLLNDRKKYLDSITLKSARNLSYYNTTSGIPTADINNNFRVYPNPTSGPLYTHSDQVIEKIIITDSQGVKVYSSENIKNTRWQCNVSLLPGIYTIQLITKSNVQSKKLCITP